MLLLSDFADHREVFDNHRRHLNEGNEPIVLSFALRALIWIYGVELVEELECAIRLDTMGTVIVTKLMGYNCGKLLFFEFGLNPREEVDDVSGLNKI